jgi:hypothetical protein
LDLDDALAAMGRRSVAHRVAAAVATVIVAGLAVIGALWVVDKVTAHPEDGRKALREFICPREPTNPICS